MKKAAIITAASLVLLLALGLIFYPVIAVRYSATHQSQIAANYIQQVADADDVQLSQIRSNAIFYNATLVPVQEEAFSSEALEKAALDYGEQLNLTGNGMMGIVRIPKIDVELPIYHGTSEATLQVGAGHLLGTSLPVGGESTHTVITAHSGMASDKMFSDLPLLEVGDVFYLEVLGETLTYQVDKITVVLPEDTSELGIVPGEDYCTLITCTPFGINTHRLLVRGTRIEPVEQSETEPTTEPEPTAKEDSNWERQYTVGLLLGLLGAAGCLMIAAILNHFFMKRERTNE